MSLARALLAMLVIAALGSGCGDDDAETQCGDRPCPRNCTGLSGPACDVLDPSCRQRVLEALICVRGTPGLLPDIRVLSEDELRSELLDAGPHDAGNDPGFNNDEDAGDDGVSPTTGLDAGTAQTSSEHDPWSAALQLLGLLPLDSDSRSASIDEGSDSIAGYYNPDQRRITLVRRDEPQNDWSAVSLFAHELVHALQDQSLGLHELGRRLPQAWDGRFAHDSLIEGEGNLYGALALALLQGVRFDSAYFAAQQRASLKYGRRHVLDSPAPYSALWHLHYPIGTSYLFDAFRDGGNWAVQRIFEAPPTSTIHLMVGYEQNAVRREHLVLPLRCDKAAAPPGYRSDSVSSLGATFLYAFLGHTLVGQDQITDSELHWRNALHWRQDSLSIFVNAAHEVAVSYRVRFDDAGLTQQLASLLAGNPRVALKVAARDDQLELIAAEDPSLVDTWQADPDECPQTPE